MLLHALLGATLSAGAVSAAPGDTGVAVPIDLAAGPGEEISTAQFTIVFDDDVVSVPLVERGPVAEAAGKMVSTNLTEAGAVRVLVSGLNQDPMADGVLVVARMDVAPEAPPGNYDVALTMLSLSDPFGIALPATAEDGAIEVTESGGNGPAGGCNCSQSKAGAAGWAVFLGDFILFGVAVLLLMAAARVVTPTPREGCS